MTKKKLNIIKCLLIIIYAFIKTLFQFISSFIINLTHDFPLLKQLFPTTAFLLKFEFLKQIYCPNNYIFFE